MTNNIITNKGATRLSKWIEENYESCNYRIAIPTYKRHETLKKKTLKVLNESDVNPEKIDIFVADEEEKSLYEKTLDNGTYGRIIIGKVGLKENRTFIQNFYPEGQYIVSLDDDIEEIHIRVNEKKVANLISLDGLFCYGYKICKEINTGLWGVYPVDNPYFMKNHIACGLRFINATMFGMINTHKPEMYITLDDKDDYERSLRAYIKYRTVARFDFISYKSKEFTEAGGMQFDGKRTLERNKQSVYYLIKKFPKLCKVNTARKDRWEVKLIEQRPEYKTLANWKINLKEN